MDAVNRAHFDSIVHRDDALVLDILRQTPSLARARLCVGRALGVLEHLRYLCCLRADSPAHCFLGYADPFRGSTALFAALGTPELRELELEQNDGTEKMAWQLSSASFLSRSGCHPERLKLKWHGLSAEIFAQRLQNTPKLVDFSMTEFNMLGPFLRQLALHSGVARLKSRGCDNGDPEQTLLPKLERFHLLGGKPSDPSTLVNVIMFRWKAGWLQRVELDLKPGENPFEALDPRGRRLAIDR